MAARGGKRDATAIDSSAGKAGNTRGWWLLFDSFLFLCTSHRRCEPHSAARTAGAIERGWPVGPSPPATPTLSATTVSLRRRRRRGPRPRHHHYHRLPPSPPPLLKTGCGTSPSPPGCHHGQTPAFPDVIKAADHVGGSTAHLPPPTPLPLAPTPSPPSIRRRGHPTLLGTRPPFGRSQAGAAARSGYVAQPGVAQGGYRRGASDVGRSIRGQGRQRLGGTAATSAPLRVPTRKSCEPRRPTDDPRRRDGVSPLRTPRPTTATIPIPYAPSP